MENNPEKKNGKFWRRALVDILIASIPALIVRVFAYIENTNLKKDVHEKLDEVYKVVPVAGKPDSIFEAPLVKEQNTVHQAHTDGFIHVVTKNSD